MRFLFLLGLMTIIAVSATAQTRLPKNYFWQKLDNGLEVIVIENNKVPLATVQIAVKNGAYTEGPEYSGLSHLFEHMFFKANRDYPNQEKFLKRTQELGAIWNGTTSDEMVNYYFTFAKDSLEAGLNFMNSAIRFPIYKEEDMQKERPVVDGEFQRGESDPWFQLWMDVGKRTWGDLFTRKNAIGDHNVINTATPEKMMIIKDKYYLPNNSLLVVIGDVKHETVFPLVQKIYGDWQASDFDPHQKYPIPEFAPIAKTDYRIVESSIAQTPFMMLQWQGPDTRKDSAATVAADVFSTILGLNSSKWQQALVNTGLATNVSASYQTNKYVGPILLFAVPNPEKLQAFYTEMISQIAHWSDPDYFTDEQLTTAKQILQRNFIRQNEKPSQLFWSLSYYWCSSSLAYFNDYQQNLQSVTRADIQRYLNTYIKNKPFVAGLIINADMNKKLTPATYFKN